MTDRKICVAVGEKDSKELYTALEAIKGADCIEVRLDYIPELDIKECFNRTEIDLLFTCRASWEGGLFAGSEDERLSLFKTAIDCGASFVDIELASPIGSIASLIDYRKNIKNIKNINIATRLIVSHHDFKTTGSKEELIAIVRGMKESGADIGKLITTAQDQSDMLRLFSALNYAKSIDFTLIAFCMGDAGVMSRVACCDFGSYMTYCAVDGKAVTAPSQLKLSAMQVIFAKLP